MKSLKSYSNCPLGRILRLFLCWTDMFIIIIMIIRFNDRVKSLYFSCIISLFTQPYDTIIIPSSFYSQGNWGLESLGTLPMFWQLVIGGAMFWFQIWLTHKTVFEKHRYIQIIHTHLRFYFLTRLYCIYYKLICPIMPGFWRNAFK